MLNFEEFKNAIVTSIKHYLPVEYAHSAINLSTIAKNNRVLEAITISSPSGLNICPSIYLNDFYDDYKNGTDIENIMQHIADIRVENEADESFDIKLITDINAIKNYIVPRLYNFDSNEAFMNDRPHRRLADLAITYHVIIDGIKDMAASVPVTNELMHGWNITESDLYAMATKNIKHLCRSTLSSMLDVIREMCPDTCEENLSVDELPMYVLSNENKLHGASAILDPDIMQSAKAILGDDFCIIPCSCHELLLVKSTSENAPAELLGMVKEVNRTSVAIADQLSDHVYKYNFETHELYIAA